MSFQLNEPRLLWLSEHLGAGMPCLGCELDRRMGGGRRWLNRKVCWIRWLCRLPGILSWKGIGRCLGYNMLGVLFSLNKTHLNKVQLIRLAWLIRFLSRFLASTVWTSWRGNAVSTKHTDEQKQQNEGDLPTQLLLSFSWKIDDDGT